MCLDCATIQGINEASEKESTTHMSDEKKPGCLFSSGVGWLTTVTCMTPFMWAGDWAKEYSLDYPWIPLLGVVLMLTVWFGGTVLLMKWLSRWWMESRYGRVALTIALELCCLTTSILLVIFVPRPRDHYDVVFAEQKAEYLTFQPEGEADGEPRLKGRCVIVTSWGDPPRAVSCFYTVEIPPSIRAESPDQVDTVIQLRRNMFKPGDPPEAELDTCEVTIIDWRTKRLLGRHKLVGTWREVKRKNKDKVWTGNLENDEEFNWLRKLQREP